MSIKSRGFTLVEVLVIAPVVILFIGVFISLLVNLTGESLVMREKNAAIYNSQSTLDDIETSIAQATSFLTTTGSVALPQGKEDYDPATAASTTPFTNTGVNGHDALIIQAATTNKSPNDSTRKLIYTGSGACDSKNPLYTYMIVYFVALDPDTADTADKALYKRMIVPPIAACETAWQRNSCNPARRSTYPTVCKANDEKLVSGISTFDVSYYIGSNTTAESDSNATQATDVSVNLGLAKQVAGNSITQGSSVRTNSVNVQAADSSGGSGGGGATAPPTNPAVQWSRNTTDPYRTTVTWSMIGNATSYTVKYRVAGGSEQTATINQPASNPPSTFSTDIEATARKQTVQLVDIVVNTNTGSFSYGSMPVISNIPQWNNCSMPSTGGWQNYGAPYNDMGFTKTSSGAVGLKGLVKLGNIGFNSAYTVCRLPAGFAPQDHLIFHGASHEASARGMAFARIDIWPDGNMIITATPGSSNAWTSFDGIIFMTASGSPAWTSGSYASPWYYNSYGDTYSNLKYYRDTLGRAWVQGLATGASGYGSGQTMGWMSAAMTPTYGSLHVPTSADGRAGGVNINGSPAIVSRPSYGGYTSTQFLYYATSGLNTLALYNNWYEYSNGWSLARCYKGTDDIVVIQGLVAGGVPAWGGMAGVHGCGTNPGMSTGRNALLPLWTNWEQPGRVDLNTDNYLYPITVDTGWTSLDGVHYIAD